MNIHKTRMSLNVISTASALLTRSIKAMKRYSAPVVICPAKAIRMGALLAILYHFFGFNAVYGMSLTVEIEEELKREANTPNREIVVMDTDGDLWGFPVDAIKEIIGEKIGFNQGAKITQVHNKGRKIEDWAFVQLMEAILGSLGSRSILSQGTRRFEYIDADNLSIQVSQILYRNRIATIHDVTNNEYKVRNLSWSCRFWVKQDEAFYEIPQPSHNIISLEREGSLLRIQYVQRGRTYALLGEILPHQLPEPDPDRRSRTPVEVRGGESFGAFNLSVSKINSLTYDVPPQGDPSSISKYSDLKKAKLILKNGKILEVDLYRFGRMDTHDDFRWDPPQKGSYRKSDVVLLFGEAEFTIDWSRIKQIDILPDDSITVTLKTGESKTGRLSETLGRNVLFWYFYSLKGNIYISPSVLKSMTLLE